MVDVSKVMTDELLIEGILEGNEEAFEELVERYGRMVYRVAYRITGSHQDADDVMQETFLKVFRSIGRFRRESNVETWIYRIALNCALNLARTKKEEPLDEGMDPVTMRVSDNPERRLERVELSEAISNAIDKLPPQQRAVVILHDMEGLTHAQISRILNCSEGTVKSRLHHARRKLRKFLKPYLG